MTYEELQSLGIEIDRGQFARGFDSDPSTVQTHRGEPENPEASRNKVKPPPITEDLSRFVIPHGGRLPRFRVLLAKRGMTLEKLAQLSGYKWTTIKQTVNSVGRSQRASERLKKLLTAEEWAFLRK